MYVAFKKEKEKFDLQITNHSKKLSSLALPIMLPVLDIFYVYLFFFFLP